MQAVILAGGFGTRISEETHLKPKPMVEIGGKPVLWHILKTYSQYNINEFIICCGYKAYAIKEYFSNYFLHSSDITFDIANNNIEIHQRRSEPWKVTVVDTGENTQTGGRLKRISEYLKPGPFCFTYGDGISDVNISKLIEFHKQKNKLATVTAVQPPGRFGSVEFEDGLVKCFEEKPNGDNRWVNGGYFVLEPEVLKFIDNDHSIWEKDCLPSIAKKSQLNAFQHEGFWQPMDTLRDRNLLQQLWEDGSAPWRIWD